MTATLLERPGEYLEVLWEEQALQHLTAHPEDSEVIQSAAKRVGGAFPNKTVRVEAILDPEQGDTMISINVFFGGEPKEAYIVLDEFILGSLPSGNILFADAYRSPCP